MNKDLGEFNIESNTGTVKGVLPSRPIPKPFEEITPSLFETPVNPESCQMTQTGKIKAEKVKNEQKLDSYYLFGQKPEPGDTNFLIKRAMTWMGRERYGQAIVDLSEAIQANTFSHKSYAERGICLYHLNQRQEAINDFTKAIELGSKDPLVFFYRGACQIDLHKTQNGLNDVSLAISLNPKNSAYLEICAHIYMTIGNYSKALQDLNEAIRITGQSEAMLQVRAIFFDFREQYKKAQQDWSKCIKLNPNSASHYVNKGNSLVFANQIEEAIKQYSKGIKIEPQPGYLLNRAVAYERIGQWAEAKADRERALSVKQ